MSLRLCQSSAGKWFIRNTCHPGHKQIERFEADDSVIRNQACFKKYAKNKVMLNKCLRGQISPYPPPMVI